MPSNALPQKKENTKPRTRMDWTDLLCSQGIDDRNPSSDKYRTEFDKDYDKLVFSRAFRRLGRKTQVHPLATNDHVHNRLSHSIEVAAVGRSLGRAIGEYVREKEEEGFRTQFSAQDFGAIVQAACLAHDIGNPPFGHAGEKAIRQWMQEHEPMLTGLSVDVCTDLMLFEGNAQGFRIAVKTKESGSREGLGLTAATLGAMTKYPWYSNHFKAERKEKFSVFRSESEQFEKLVKLLGLLPKIEKDDRDDDQPEYTRYCRHPLVFLVEAADDICNTIIDIEDAVELEILRHGDVKKDLMKLRGKKEIDGLIIAEHRAEAISYLIKQCCTVFENKYDDIMNGEDVKPLIKLIPAAERRAYKALNDLAADKVYPFRRNTELELGCYSSLSTLLDNGMTAALNINSGKKTYKQDNLLKLIGDEITDDNLELYEKYMLVTDFISGMTDNYATYIAAQLSGHAR